MNIEQSTRPTLRGIFAFLTGFALCLAVLEIGVVVHSDLIGQTGFLGAWVVGGTGLGYFFGGRAHMADGFTVVSIIGILIAIAYPASS